MAKTAWFVGRALILLAVLMILGCQGAAKPQQKEGMTALLFADRYALHIAQQQYQQILKVSTPENSDLINNEIKPFLKQLAAENNRPRLVFKEVQFLSANMIGGDKRHLLVMEALVPAVPIKQGERIILSFEVRPRGDEFEVVSSHLRLDDGDKEKDENEGLP